MEVTITQVELRKIFNDTNIQEQITKICSFFIDKRTYILLICRRTKKNRCSKGKERRVIK